MNSEPQSVAQRDRETQTLTVRQETKVGWFDVRQLLATGAKVFASTIVGSMSGRREIMAALDPHPDGQMLLDHDYAGHDVLWLDYVADTGDGWDTTYSVAYLVGRDAVYLLENGEPTPQPISASGTEEAGVGPDCAPAIRLPRGSILVLGGDQVYPTASAEAYQGRLQDPFQCAHLADDRVAERHVYAIPGNHDWYDGLTAFIRLFCQHRRRTIGIWRTQQRRSYFAIRLRAFVIVFTIIAGVLIFVVNGVLFGAYLLIGNLSCVRTRQQSMRSSCSSGPEAGNRHPEYA